MEAFTINRRRGAYTRCRGLLNTVGLGLQAPEAACRLLVKSDAGVPLFQGYVESVRRGSPAGATPFHFEALEDAYRANTPPDSSLQPGTSTVHAVQFRENTIRLQSGSVNAEERAGDVIVTGAEEPVTYATELFSGDGTTAAFTLTEKPFARSGSETLLNDSFLAGAFRADVWRFLDTGQHIGLGAGGLRLSGGNGFDGQTVMAAQTPIELGGALCAEMRGVLLQPGSDGVLLGMYGNAVTRPNCFAGVRADATAGAQNFVAMVDGAVVGTAFAWIAGHSYTLRLRLYCAEMQRVLATYQAVVHGAVESWGSGLVDAPMQIVVEVLDEGLASSTPATVLYAGAVSSSLAHAVFAPVNSVSLVGSVAGCSLRQQGSLWVTSTAPDGTVVQRRPGTLDTGEDYTLRGNVLAFFPGRVPAPGERVTARYRLKRRAEARAQSDDALSEAQQMGLPGLRRSVCRVRGPEPRSTADCAAVAQALLAWYGDPAFGVRGSCTLTDASGSVSVQPGDTVALPLSHVPVNVPVERVTVTSAHAVPEVLVHSVTFAQTAATCLGFTVEQGAAADASLPADLYTACTTASLPQLSVTVAGTVSLQVDAGVAAPVGGGFEVRRHDGGWGPDVSGAPPDDELVLRSPVRSFSLPRTAFAERFFVRMYDGSQPPVYSAESSLIVTHLPME